MAKNYLTGVFALALLLFMHTTPARASVNVTGLEGELEHNSEYLFGFSGQSANLLLGLSGGGSINLSAGSNQGWWSATSGNSSGNTNYFVGDLSNNGSVLLNNFFTFNPGQATGQTIVSATLRLVRAVGQSTMGNAFHTYSLFDVSTSAATLNANNGTSQAIFDDLGSGTNYGDFNVSVAGASSQVLSFGLNGDGLADINAALANSQLFSIGGTLTPSIDPVPEAASFVVWTALLGIGLVVGCRRYLRPCAATHSGT